MPTTSTSTRDNIIDCAPSVQAGTPVVLQRSEGWGAKTLRNGFDRCFQRVQGTHERREALVAAFDTAPQSASGRSKSAFRAAHCVSVSYGGSPGSTGIVQATGATPSCRASLPAGSEPSHVPSTPAHNQRDDEGTSYIPPCGSARASSFQQLFNKAADLAPLARRRSRTTPQPDSPRPS